MRHISFCSAGNLLFSSTIIFPLTIYLSNKSRGTELFLRINNFLGANDPQPWKGSLNPKEMPSAEVVIDMSWKCVYLSPKRNGAGRIFEIYISTCENIFSKPSKRCYYNDMNVLGSCSSYSRNFSRWYIMIECIWLCGSCKNLLMWHSEKTDKLFWGKRINKEN